MRKHLLWILPALIAGYLAAYLLTTSTQTLPLLARRHVTRVYDHDWQAWVFWPAAGIERLLRSPDEFVFRQRSIVGI
jgi:hypothetical protein